jgi:DinB family protein
LIDGLSDSKLQARPAPGKWSVGEILAHLAEDELATAWRYRQMIEHRGCALASFARDQWARLGDYASWNPKEALELFRWLRAANLRMLAQLGSEDRQKYGVHAERGELTVSDLVRHMAGHDMNHIDQVRRILSRQ